VSVGNAGQQRQIANVAAGTEASDAANVEQVAAGDAETLDRANAYTDLRADRLLSAQSAAVGELRTYVDDRLDTQDRRIDRQGAMSAAMMNMAASAAGIRTPHRVSVGSGFSGGQQALSLGYQRAISDRAAVTVSGAFSGNESATGVGLSFGW
jgi:autotransporter adhesin